MAAICAKETAGVDEQRTEIATVDVAVVADRSA
jgi:hypothetical protein